MFFDQVQQGAPDVMYHLKVEADKDLNPNKVDLGAGIYRNEVGVYHELKAVKEAKERLAVTNPTHDYEVTTGNEEYLRCAARVVFGKDSPILESGRGNYQFMCEISGLELKTYNHYKPETGEVDWDSTLKAVRSAPQGSTFILQACCHNPTAADFSKRQWKLLALEMKARNLLPLFDIVYQGMGNGLEEDIFCVRHFAKMGFEMLVCQSFSKSFGLYGERVGALHVVCSNPNAATAVHDQLRFLIRSEFSSSPAYGARIVTTVLSNTAREAAWLQELNGLRERLHRPRKKLFHLLTGVCQTPGDWAVITRGTGLFCLLPLSPDQCLALRKQHHIYLVPNGRITIPSLNDKNLKYVAESIDAVVRSVGKPAQSRI